MSRLKKDDQVIVIAGNHKGLTGNVLKVLKDKILVQGVNVRKKHVKATQENPKGSIVQMEKPIHISNVALNIDGVPVKLRSKLDDKGNKVLFYIKDGKEIVHRKIKS